MIRITKVKKSNISNNVLCASNDSIVAYCDTVEEAEYFIKKFNKFKLHFPITKMKR